MNAAIVIPMAALLALTPSFAKAQWMSGPELLRRCQSGDQNDSAVCDGYLMAVMDVLKQRELYPNQGRFRLCMAEGTPVATVRELAIRFSKQRRSGPPLTGVQVVTDALGAYTRCAATAVTP